MDFCNEQQLDYKYFHARKRTFLKLRQSKLALPFIKVSKTLPSNTGMSLQLGDAKLSLPINTDPDWLAQLLKALSV